MKVTVCNRCDKRIPEGEMELEIDEPDAVGGTLPWRISLKSRMGWPDGKGSGVDLCWDCVAVLRKL